MIKEARANKNKRGLSPIIATVLLIGISLALAVIIFMWARSFFPEAIMKSGTNIEDVCKEVDFLADYDIGSSTLTVENTGSIPIFALEIKEKTGGDIVNLKDETNGIIGVSETLEIGLEVNGDADELIVTPILLGEDDASRKKWVCDDEYAQIIGLKVG